MILEKYFNQTNKPLLLDGAIGSLLEQKNYKSKKYLWTSYLNFKQPKVVQEIYKSYAKAGADILTTNTFRTNPVSLNKSNTTLNCEQAVKLSANLTKEITRKYKLLLAGSNPPAEDCYQKGRTISKNELLDNHHKHISLLYENGCDFILSETQSHLDEIEIILNFCKEKNIPHAISLYLLKGLNLLSGESITEVLDFIKSYSPLFISFNCISKNIFYDIINKVKLDFNWGFYLNCGSENFNNNFVCELSPKEYSEIVNYSLTLKPKIIGACCGSNPLHIKSIRKMLDENFTS
ncbi:MAG: hypothetical protein CR986_00125 [Ignavibacteriae bacterium]|nr:MAG: hypothetical protein CR986_00125 [Ignavibacteriota bacterium]